MKDLFTALAKVYGSEEVEHRKSESNDVAAKIISPLSRESSSAPSIDSIQRRNPIPLLRDSKSRGHPHLSKITANLLGNERLTGPVRTAPFPVLHVPTSCGAIFCACAVVARKASERKRGTSRARMLRLEGMLCCSLAQTTSTGAVRVRGGSVSGGRRKPMREFFC